MHTLRFAGAVLAAAVALPAHAAIIAFDSGTPVTNPTNQTGFERFTQVSNPANVPYVEDGIAVTFVSTSGLAQVSSFLPRTGDDNFQIGGAGDYVRIRMTNGSLIDGIHWWARGRSNQAIYWQALRGGNLVQANHFSAFGSDDLYRAFGLLVTSPGQQFDELRLVTVRDGTPFAPNNSSSFFLDDLFIHAIDPPTAVPEPGAWALMVAGFGLAGAGLRRRRFRGLRPAAL